MEAVQLCTREFWQSFAPRFHIADPQFLQNSQPLDLQPQHARLVTDAIRIEGYVQANNVNWGADTKAMADTVRALAKASLSPSLRLSL